MQIKYIGPSADLELPDGTVVERGGSVDVDDALGESLCDSGDFVATKPSKNTKPEEATS